MRERRASLAGRFRRGPKSNWAKGWDGPKKGWRKVACLVAENMISSDIKFLKCGMMLNRIF